ncbi:hypothetical protein FKW77_001710 [Venturia effusa]|uniref:Heterokaryon incompatibility domain-containing protein n=1 Tax=Venturia effusa TaxID=50376 RepID=A0A517LAF2_9PEZI|nr:hypothetical protein FKW77_001710 [Venturia effusa]
MNPVKLRDSDATAVKILPEVAEDAGITQTALSLEREKPPRDPIHYIRKLAQGLRTHKSLDAPSNGSPERVLSNKNIQTIPLDFEYGPEKADRHGRQPTNEDSCNSGPAAGLVMAEKRSVKESHANTSVLQNKTHQHSVLPIAPQMTKCNERRALTKEPASPSSSSQIPIASTRKNVLPPDASVLEDDNGMKAKVKNLRHIRKRLKKRRIKIDSISIGCINAPPLCSTQHQYSPLESHRHIRLLSVRTFRSKTNQSVVLYDMVTVTLDSAPPFEALSYVWGDAERPHNLFFANRRHLPITTSLSSALPLISTHCTTEYLWIDQICIDQGNVLERNHQVKIMGEIYRMAVRVLLYTGVFDSELSSILSIAEDHEMRQCSLAELQSALEDLLQYKGPSWLALNRFLKNEWFSRAWCFQEFALAKDPRFLIGKRLVAFDILDRLTLAVYRIEALKVDQFQKGQQECITKLPGCLRIFDMARVRSELAALGRCRDFWQLLSNVAPNSLCSDPRDILYAYLGLLEDNRIEINADYDSGLQYILIKATKAVIKGTQDLSILGFVPRVNSSFSEDDGIPSWVADWRQREQCFSLTPPGRSCPFSAAAGRLHAYTQSGKRLRVKGKVIARVADCIGPSMMSNEHWTSRDLTSLLALKDKGHHIVASTSGLSSVVDSHLLKRILRVILAGGIMMSERLEEEAHKDFENILPSLLTAYHSHEDGIVEERLSTLRYLSIIALNRRLYSTNNGQLLLAHQDVEWGDRICIFHGSRVPVVVELFDFRRPFGYKVRGQCYLEGAMYGEMVDWTAEEAEEFVLD